MSSSLDISDGARPQHRYCIASTPRSGSTLISRMLLSSKLAGDPKEYLNPSLIQAWHQMNQRSISIPDYLKELEARRTSRNGFFGMKIHGSHLVELSKKIAAKEINLLIQNFDKFIFVTRKDKINQAISYFIARATGVFHFDQEHWLQEFDIPEPIFHAEEILRLLADLLRQEEVWGKFCSTLKSRYTTLRTKILSKITKQNQKKFLIFLGLTPLRCLQCPPGP